MTEYSAQTVRLAHELAATLGKKLEGTDRKLIQEPSGRYVIIPRDAAEPAEPGKPGRWRALVTAFRRRMD